MSYNNLAVIYKFRTISDRIAYLVWYDNNNAEAIVDMSFEEFRDFTKKHRLTWSIDMARHIAFKIQQEKVPEYSYIVYEGYFNAFYEEGYPSQKIFLKNNPKFNIESQDKNDKTDIVETESKNNDITTYIDKIAMLEKDITSKNEELTQLKIELTKQSPKSILQLFKNYLW